MCDGRTADDADEARQDMLTTLTDNGIVPQAHGGGDVDVIDGGVVA